MGKNSLSAPSYSNSMRLSWDCYKEMRNVVLVFRMLTDWLARTHMGLLKQYRSDKCGCGLDK
jgi:hypothetical protein